MTLRIFKALFAGALLAADAAVRCPGTTIQYLTVKSAQFFTLRTVGCHVMVPW